MRGPCTTRSKIAMTSWLAAGFLAAAACDPNSNSRSVPVTVGGRSPLAQAMTACQTQLSARATESQSAATVGDAEYGSVPVVREGESAAKTCAASGPQAQASEVRALSRYRILVEKPAARRADAPAPTQFADAAPADPARSGDAAAGAIAAAGAVDVAAQTGSPGRGANRSGDRAGRTSGSRAPRVRIALSPRVELGHEGATEAELRSAVDRIGAACVPRVVALFQRFQIALDLEFRPRIASESASDALPLLRLRRVGEDPAAGWKIEAWPRRATLFPSGDPSKGNLASLGIAAREARLFSDNGEFCQDVAKLVGLWLGMSDPEAHACETQASTAASPGGEAQPAASPGVAAPPGASPGADGSPAPAPGAEGQAASPAQPGVNAPAAPAPSSATNFLLGSSFPKRPGSDYWLHSTIQASDRIRPLEPVCTGLRDALSADRRGAQDNRRR